jgi:hypothetical protein
MPRNGSGIYNLPAGNPVVPGTVIQTAWANSTMSDIAAALTASLTVDGQTSPVANQPMGGFKHTGVAPATANDEYATAGQVQHQSFNVVGGAAMAVVNVYTGTMPLGITSFTNGMFAILVVPNPGSNTGAATLTINGGTPQNILDGNGGPLSAGALSPGAIALLGWDGTNWRSVLGGAGSALGYVPVNKAGDTMTGALTVPGPLTMTQAVGGPAMVAKSLTANPGANASLGSFQWHGTNDGVNGIQSAFMRGGVPPGANWAVGNTPSQISFNVTPVGTSVNQIALIINPTLDAQSSRGFYTLPANLTPAAGASIIVRFQEQAQVINITLAGNLTITAAMDAGPQGAMMRLLFRSTNLGTVTWPAYVNWPLGAVPNLAAGTIKQAIVTLIYGNGTVLGSASVY